MRTRLLLVVSALITYGSLYPFHFTLPVRHAEAWEKLFQNWTLITYRGDMLGNLLLFVPFGFAGMFALPGESRPPRVAAVVAAAFALAAVLQVAQIYFPPRTPAIADVFWNMVGAILGVVASVTLGNHLRVQWRDWRPGYLMPLALLALWIGAELMPFVPSLDLQAIKNSVKALLRLGMSPSSVLWHAAGALVAGRALAAIVGVPKSWRLLALMVGAVAAGKVLVVSQVLNTSTLLGFALGCAGWWLLSREGTLRLSAAAVPLALLAAYTLKALAPFELRSVPADFHWVPFASMLEGSMLVNAGALAESAFAFAALLGLLRMQGSPIGAAAVVLALWAGALEAAQMYIVGRTPDITEPLLVLLIALLVRAVPAAGARSAPARTSRSRGARRR